MNTKMDEIYQKILNESRPQLVVDNTGDIPGAEKAKPIKVEQPTGVKKPTEDTANSQEEVKKGGATANAEKAPVEKKSVREGMRFNELYKSILKEAELGETIPTGEPPAIESGSYDEDIGDFEGGDEMSPDGEEDAEDEVDIATELQLIADRLLEIKDKLSGFDSEEGTDELGEMPEEGISEGEGEEVPPRPMGESFKVNGTPQKAKATTLGPKMSKTVKGKLSSVAKKTAALPKQVARTGTPEKAKATTLGPKMSQVVPGNIKGKNQEFLK